MLNSGSESASLVQAIHADGSVSRDGEIAVPTTTLDDELSPSDRVWLLKIDVQGAELAVLRGKAAVRTHAVHGPPRTPHHEPSTCSARCIRRPEALRISWRLVDLHRIRRTGVAQSLDAHEALLWSARPRPSRERTRGPSHKPTRSHRPTHQSEARGRTS